MFENKMSYGKVSVVSPKMISIGGKMITRNMHGNAFPPALYHFFVKPLKSFLKSIFNCLKLKNLQGFSKAVTVKAVTPASTVTFDFSNKLDRYDN
mgnify:CR=1 FL=1